MESSGQHSSADVRGRSRGDAVIERPNRCEVGPVVSFIPASRAVVEGSGYRPGTLVEVWLFSTATRLAAVTVEADRTFTASALSPASLASGAHTLVISGVSADATPEATSLSVQVTEPDQPPVPASQADPAPLSFTG